MKFGVGVWLLTLALSAVGCGDSATEPKLSFEASTLMFPDTLIDRVSASGIKSITVTNVSDGSVTPSFGLLSYEDFAIESTTCGTLAPGAGCEVVVRFAPHTLGVRSVDLVGTVGTSSVATTLVGMALPEPGLSAPSQLTYDDVALGTTKTLRLTVTNSSAVKGRPYTVALDGADVGDFIIVANACSGREPARFSACTIDVAFAPLATAPRSAQLVVSSGNLGSVMIALGGNGYVPAQLAVSPGSGTFGTVFALGNSPAQTFTVTNAGTVPSPALQVAISGTHAYAFLLTDGCSGSTLAGGASCMFSIVFRPYAPGMHVAAATVSAGALTPVEVPLTGSGDPAQIQLTPPGWNFGQVVVGQTTAEKTLTAENTGATNTGPLTVSFWVPNAAFTIVNDGCTGVDLAPGATCTVGVTVTPTARDLSFANLLVKATRGDTAIGTLQVQGILAATLTPTSSAAAFGDVQLTENPKAELSGQSSI